MYSVEDKKTYARRNIFFFLISVPYLNILHYCGVSLDHTVRYLIHFIPMIRAGYVLSIVTGLLTTSDRIKGMSLVYTMLIMASIYFCALVGRSLVGVSRCNDGRKQHTFLHSHRQGARRFSVGRGADSFSALHCLYHQYNYPEEKRLGGRCF